MAAWLPGEQANLNHWQKAEIHFAKGRGLMLL